MVTTLSTVHRVCQSHLCGYLGLISQVPSLR
jgi:hypothetical protein